MYAQGASLLTQLGNKYKDNESIAGFVSGTFADAGRTMMMGGLSLGYNKAMSSHLAQLNQGLENLKTGNQLKLMGAEGRITQQLIGAQGMQQRLGIRETGRQQRAGYREQGRQERMNIGALGASGLIIYICSLLASVTSYFARNYQRGGWQVGRRHTRDCQHDCARRARFLALECAMCEAVAGVR